MMDFFSEGNVIIDYGLSFFYVIYVLKVKVMDFIFYKHAAFGFTKWTGMLWIICGLL